MRITGLSSDRLDGLYWKDRQAYDEGKLAGLEFWRKLLDEAGIELSEPVIAELNLWDARMWTLGDAAMLDGTEIKQRGLLTAIVSNMGDAVHEHMERELDWLSRFDVQVWSYQLRVAKPDPAIYRYALERLGTRPEETLFLDDRAGECGCGRCDGNEGFGFLNRGKAAFGPYRFRVERGAASAVRRTPAVLSPVPKSEGPGAPVLLWRGESRFGIVLRPVFCGSRG